jgi:hypothetical protein
MILARIYMGDDYGGPVDYSTPFLETAADNVALPPLAPGGSRRVAVRFADSDTGLEELNTDANILIIVSDSGVDVSIMPPAPAGVEVRDAGPGAALVTWQVNLRAGDEPPDAWDVYATPGATVDYTAPVGSVAHDIQAVRYSLQLTGYAAGAPVAVAVRSRKGAALSPNPAVFPWIPAAVPGAATRPAASVVDYEI